MKYNFKTDGIGFFEGLAIGFIILKLLGVIDWSWWIVLSPIWVQLIMIAVIVIVGLIVLKRKNRI